MTIDLYSAFDVCLRYFGELCALLWCRVVSFQRLLINPSSNNLCGMGSALVDFVWSRGRKSLILLECGLVGIMSLFQIGMHDPQFV